MKTVNEFMVAVAKVSQELQDWTETGKDGRLIINAGHQYNLEQLIHRLLAAGYLEYQKTQDKRMKDILRLIVDDALGYEFNRWLFTKSQLLPQKADIKIPITYLCENPHAIKHLQKALNMVVKLESEKIILIEPAVKELKKAGAEPAGTDETQDEKQSPKLETKAIAVLMEHPDWTNKKIAKVIGCHEKSLSRFERFRASRALLKKQGKDSIYRGYKDKEGNIDAYE